jgi:DNA-binding MarR family transcriptional regulator
MIATMRPNEQLLLKVGTASEYVRQIVDLQMAPVGIPAYLLGTLTHVRDLTPVSPTELSRVSGVPVTTLRDNIQRLVDRKLARRAPNPKDGRSYLVTLTRRGEAVTQAASAALYDAYLAVERHLPASLEEFEDNVDALNEALEAALRDLVGAEVPARRAS